MMIQIVNKNGLDGFDFYPDTWALISPPGNVDIRTEFCSEVQHFVGKSLFGGPALSRDLFTFFVQTAVHKTYNAVLTQSRHKFPSVGQLAYKNFASSDRLAHVMKRENNKEQSHLEPSLAI
eukprot:m.61317 g.61317  ORF g.61317 m.61317 type:complete len:121 (+) comp34996_c0_seq3:1317-1679(+)